MTRDDEPKYYNDPNYVDPFTKFWKEHQPWKKYVLGPWQRYEQDVGSLYARIDPDIPERVPVRIRSLFLMAAGLCFAGIALYAAVTQVHIIYAYFYFSFFVAVWATLSFYWKARTALEVRGEAKWILRGWKICALIPAFLAFNTAHWTSSPGPFFRVEHESLLQTIAVVSSVILILAVIGSVVYVERRFKSPPKLS